MTDPIRSALKRLLSAVLDGLGQDDHPMGWARVDDAIDAARAALAAEADGPAVPEGKKPTRDELWELWLRLNNELPDRPAAVAEFWEHAQIDARARAALAEPEPELEPTDDELFAVAEAYAEDNGLIGLHNAPDFARAVLARWGHPTPQPPAAGEVVGLVKTLKGIAYWRRHGKPGEPAPTSFDIRQADRLDRAAELLQRQVLPEVGE